MNLGHSNFSRLLRSFHSLAMTEERKFLCNYSFTNAMIINITTVVYIAAPRSSSITPQPPGKSSNFLRGGGFMISKILNNTNVMASGNILCGVKYKGINKQAYSSITIWCGSLPQIFVRSFEIAIPSATSPMVNAT